MVRILLIVFISAFSFVFGGCSVCKIKNTVLIEQLNEFCADVEWLFKSYEERIEYSLRPFLDNIKGDFKEYQELREKIFTFVGELKIPREEPIKEEEIEAFLEKFFDPNIIEEEGAYIFAKEKVKETLKKLNDYLGKWIRIHKGRGNRLEDPIKEDNEEEFINEIVLSIYIAKDTIEKKNKKSLEFIRELSKLYKSEKGNVGGFVKLQQRNGEENYNNSVYNIDELYRIFEKIYEEGKVCVNNSKYSIAEALADAVVEFYNGEKVVDKGKQEEMFKKEIGLIRMDVIRTFPKFKEYFNEEHFKEQKNDEFKKILSKMLFFALFCIRLINEKEGSPSLSANDKIKELSGMKGLGEKQKDDIYKQMKREPTSFTAYVQGLNFFAGFFVILYFIVNQKFGGNVNKEEIIDWKKEIIDESKIIKLFVFYLLHKWNCDSSVNYLPSFSLYDTYAVIDLPIFILLRRCKLLHMYTNYDFNNDLLSNAFASSFFTCSLSRTTNDNYCLDYIMYLDLHLYIVKKKDINFYFDWFNFLYYKILHIIEKKDLKYYGDGPYAEIVKVLFSSDKNRSIVIEQNFFNRKV